MDDLGILYWICSTITPFFTVLMKIIHKQFMVSHQNSTQGTMPWLIQRTVTEAAGEEAHYFGTAANICWTTQPGGGAMGLPWMGPELPILENAMADMADIHGW